VDRERLMSDTGIIRNRAKIDATIRNATVTAALMRESPGALTELIWSMAPTNRQGPPDQLSDVPAITPESRALAVALKKLGFAFVGPTTAYAHMQAVGVVNDHVADCHRAQH
jgi:DNA-3-methyladenine glycosylase I